MLSGLLTEKALSWQGNGNAVQFVASRCLRMRYRNSSCGKCREQCRAGAISFDGQIRINGELCRGCMLCTAACPTEALTFQQHDFEKTVAGLAASDLVILACKRQGFGEAHISLPCLGALSEYHLLALLAATRGKIKIDLRRCGTCENAFVADVVKERLSLSVTRFFPDEIHERIRLLSGAEDEEGFSGLGERRAFFVALKLSFCRQTGKGARNEQQPTGYSQKKLPLKTRLLRYALIASSSDMIRAGVLRNFLYSLTVGDACDLCGACVGMCPTGALKMKSPDGSKIVRFQTENCCGCGLCEEYCRKKAITLAKEAAPRSIDSEKDKSV